MGFDDCVGAGMAAGCMPIPKTRQSMVDSIPNHMPVYNPHGHNVMDTGDGCAPGVTKRNSRSRARRAGPRDGWDRIPAGRVPWRRASRSVCLCAHGSVGVYFRLLESRFVPGCHVPHQRVKALPETSERNLSRARKTPMTVWNKINWIETVSRLALRAE